MGQALGRTAEGGGKEHAASKENRQPVTQSLSPQSPFASTSTRNRGGKLSPPANDACTTTETLKIPVKACEIPVYSSREPSCHPVVIGSSIPRNISRLSTST